MFVLTIVVGVLMSLSSAATGIAARRGGVAFEPVQPSVRVASATDPASLLPSALIAGMVSETYHRVASLSPSADPLPTEASVVSSIDAMFALVRGDPRFLSLLGAEGASNFSLGLSYDTRGITSAYYTFNWAAPSGAHTEYWVGAVAAGTVSGPFLKSYPLAYTSTTDYTNWAGWEFWCNPGCGGASTTALGDVQADGVRATISSPPQAPANVPNGIFVHAVAAVWVGLSPKADGSGGLLQTGYETDATNPTWYSYTPWYEFWPNPQYVYPGATSLPAGKYVWESLAWQSTPGYWLAEVGVMGSGGYGWSQMVNTGTSWTPYYAEQITEAYSYTENVNGNPTAITQQIAQFSQVGFGDSFICSFGNGCYGTTDYLQYHAGQYNIAQLTQWCAFNFFGCWSAGLNTNQNWADSTCGFYGGSGCAQVSWVTSQFDYNYAH